MRDWKSQPYATVAEMELFNNLGEHIFEDTLKTWVRTRRKGISASLACDGNVSIPLLRALDRVIGK